jgi:hypothetical protein
MNRGRVGEERRGKEMDGCSLTMMKAKAIVSMTRAIMMRVEVSI